MFQTIYIFWGLLPLIFICLTIWGKTKRFFGAEGREDSGEAFKQALFTSIAFAIAIYLDQAFTLENGEYLSILGTEGEGMILHLTLFPIVLVGMAYLNKIFNKIRGTETKVDLSEGLARYRR